MLPLSPFRCRLFAAWCLARAVFRALMGWNPVFDFSQEGAKLLVSADPNGVVLGHSFSTFRLDPNTARSVALAILNAVHTHHPFEGGKVNGRGFGHSLPDLAESSPLQCRCRKCGVSIGPDDPYFQNKRGDVACVNCGEPEDS